MTFAGVLNLTCFCFRNLVTVKKSLKTVSSKVALNRVKQDGNPSETEFKRISYDGQTSIVKCQSLTDRPHQIRVHLQYIGYPIANDTIYSNEWVWGPSLGKDGNGDDIEIEQKLEQIGRTVPASSFINPLQVTQDTLIEGKKDYTTNLHLESNSNDSDLWLYDISSSETHAENSQPVEIPFPEWALQPHLKYMEMAMDEARKCEGTQVAFSVGAVLVKDDQVLSTGFSRELPGNTHAEQCALEKYFAKHNVTDVPQGSVIYTTMEPCSERLSGNLPCTDRILNSSIRTVFVGVVEPKTFIANNVGRQKLEDAGIEYIHIPGYEKQCLEIATKK